MAQVDITPQFGAELKDGFKPVNAWTTGGIEWLEDVQQFYRERALIEKEYSAKLAALAKKYFEKKTKKTSTLSVGETPTVTPGSLESASMTTWGTQLSTLESRAAEHDRFANELTSNLAEPLKTLAIRCEELRKQHAEYATKLEHERDASYSELKKVKGKYDSTCQEVENRRKKIDSSFDHGKQKAQGAYQQQLADMHNAKNVYLININVTNKQKERYYHDYLPEVLDSLQALSESRVAKLNAIWLMAAQIEKSVLDRSTDYVKHLALEVPRNNPNLDSMMFVRHNTANWTEPADFAFEPSPVWLDDDAMPSDETSKVFLRNILVKSKGSLGELKREVDTSKREVDKMRQTRQAVRSGKDNKDEVEVARALFALQEQLHEVERKKTTAEIEVSTITTAVGDVSIGAKNHNFKPQTFKIPTTCDLCGERIWGLSAKGFDCKDCGFTCHTKCEMKVPANCPGESSKDEKRRLKVERQEAAQAAPQVDNPVPDRQATISSLNRKDTVNSLNTLSSGYATSTARPVSDTPMAASEDVAEKKPAPSPATARKNRVMAPPPTQWNAAAPPPRANGDPSKRGKMLYPYEKNADGELTVNEGQEISLVEPDDGSGWIKVRAGTQEGFVPAAYAEIATPSAVANLSDGERPGSTYSASSASGSVAGGQAAAGKKKGPAVAPKRGAKMLKYVEALYDWDARSPDEHSMTEGEKLVVITRDTGDGWAEVEKNGAVKSVPANYIQDA